MCLMFLLVLEIGPKSLVAVVHDNIVLNHLLTCTLQVVRVDLSSIKCCCSGPKSLSDRIDIGQVKADFECCLRDSESPQVSQ